MKLRLFSLVEKIIIYLLLGIQIILAQDFWQQTNGPGSPVYTVATNSNGHIFVATYNQGLFRSTNNGVSWTRINSGLTSIYVWVIAVDSSGHLLAGSQDAGLFRSTNNGDNWTATSLANLPISSIAVNDSGYIFVGTGYGVFRSKDGGDSWSEETTGLTSLDITSLAIDPLNDFIYAGTYDGGVFKSTDNAKNWNQTSLSTEWVASLIINSSGYIFAGTWGNGVYRSTNEGDNWVKINNGLSISIHLKSSRTLKNMLKTRLRRSG